MAVADLDTQYQAAVEKNDAGTMALILADDFTLVTGRGRIFSKSDLLKSARDQDANYEQQKEEPGTRAGKPFDYRLWFSDTYVRTPAGWKYYFGQASLPLPKE